MAAKKRSGIDIGANAFVTDREAVLVPRGADGEMLTLYARKLGHLELSEIIAVAHAQQRSFLIPLVVASIENDDGERFTEDEVQRLKQEVAGPLFKAAMHINGLNATDEDPAKN